MKHLRNSAHLSVLLLLALLVGCQFFGVPTPDTFNKKLASGYSMLTSIQVTNLTLLRAGVLTPDDSENVSTQANTTKAGLDIARGLRDINFVDANIRLESTLAIVNALNEYLQERQDVNE